jgi:hypothetical protein
LIIEGDECKLILKSKVEQLENKDSQIKEMNLIRSELDTIIEIQRSQLILSDSVISNKDQIIIEKDKKIKKANLRSYAIAAISVLLFILI